MRHCFFIRSNSWFLKIYLQYFCSMQKFCVFFFILSTCLAASPLTVFQETQKLSAVPGNSMQLAAHFVTQNDVLQPCASNFGIAGADIRQPVFPVITVARQAHSNHLSSQLEHLLLRTSYAAVEMFGNTRLSYNYPFHNFW